MQEILNRKYISLTEIAKMHGRTRQAVHQRAKRRRVPLEKLGRMTYVRRADIHLLGYI